MKTRLFILASLAALAACQTVAPDTSVAPAAEVGMIEVKAVLADQADPATRTTLDDGKTIQKWSETDEIYAVAADGTQTACAVKSIDEQGVATFEIPENTAFATYPTNKLSIADNTVTMTLPMKQTLSEAGSELIGDKANPMFGKLDGTTLRFTNLGGILVFQLTGTKTLTSLTFKSNNLKTPALSGLATFNKSEAVPTLAMVSGAGNNHYGYVKVKGRDIQLGATPTNVALVVPPATYENALVIFEFSDGSAYSYMAQAPIKVERSKVKKIAPINVDSLLPKDPVDLSESGTKRSNCYMVIASEEPRAYSFPAVHILGEEFDGAKVAQIHWTESPTLFNNVCFDAASKTISFLYGGKGEEGNATVALDKNEDSFAASILWTWHLWATDQPRDVIIRAKDEANQMPNYILDRNVGATWAPATRADVDNMTLEQAAQTLGVFHQFGNHITFPRGKSYYNEASGENWKNSHMAVIYGFSNYCQKMATSGSIKDSFEETQKFPNYQYHKNDGKINNNNLQRWINIDIACGPAGEGESPWFTTVNTKEKLNDHDPCPQGYVIVTTTDLYRTTLEYKFQNKEMTGAGEGLAGKWVEDEQDNLIWFPAAGYLGTARTQMVGRRIALWPFSLTGDALTNVARRTTCESGQNAFQFGNVPFMAQAHNTRCRKL